MDYDRLFFELEAAFMERNQRIPLVEALKKIHDWPPDDPQAVKEMKLIAGYALADLEKKQG